VETTIAKARDGGRSRDARRAVLSDGWLTAVRDPVGERAVDIVVLPTAGRAA
jgi:hypothetical protein